MVLLFTVLEWLCLLLGSIFLIIGGIGIHRFPDLFTRFHAASITDTLGAGFILLGLMIAGGMTLVTVKLLMILIFIFITSPSSTHALAKAAIHGGLKPKLDDHKDNREKPS